MDDLLDGGCCFGGAGGGRDFCSDAFGLKQDLSFLAGIGFGLWWFGNWLWDVIGALFGGGSSGDLEYYCAYKWNSATSALYQQCVSEGWKDWYANAHWMQGR